MGPLDKQMAILADRFAGAAHHSMPSGAGLVTVAVPEELLPIVAAVEPSYLTLGLPDNDDGQFSLDARPTIDYFSSPNSPSTVEASLTA